jgi:hypothetical protein
MVAYDPLKDAEGWPSPAEGTPLLRERTPFRSTESSNLSPSAIFYVKP